MRMKFKSQTPPLCFGKPDSPVRPLCAICHGALGDVPLMLCAEDGRVASVCDDCVERWVEVEK